MRLFTAFTWFFKILAKGDAAFAEAPVAAAAPEAPKPVFAKSSNPAVQLLSLLQKEGRLVDFLHEDIAAFSDAEIGAAVRPIHAGSRRALLAAVPLSRVATEAEGSPITLPAGFDPSCFELQGNVSGAAPYRGTLVHGGWIAGQLKLPTVPAGADPTVVAPAQVEVR